MNPIIIGACFTAAATVIAAVISAIASVRASHHAKNIDAAVETPDGVPSLAQMMPELFIETMRQGGEIDSLAAKFEEHLEWHLDHWDGDER